jgi:hypothetical protein
MGPYATREHQQFSTSQSSAASVRFGSRSLARRWLAADARPHTDGAEAEPGASAAGHPKQQPSRRRGAYMKQATSLTSPSKVRGHLDYLTSSPLVLESDTAKARFWEKGPQDPNKQSYSAVNLVISYHRCKLYPLDLE